MHDQLAWQGRAGFESGALARVCQLQRASRQIDSVRSLGFASSLAGLLGQPVRQALPAKAVVRAFRPAVGEIGGGQARAVLKLAAALVQGRRKPLPRQPSSSAAWTCSSVRLGRACGPAPGHQCGPARAWLGTAGLAIPTHHAKPLTFRGSGGPPAPRGQWQGQENPVWHPCRPDRTAGDGIWLSTCQGSGGGLWRHKPIAHSGNVHRSGWPGATPIGVVPRRSLGRRTRP